MEYALAFGPVIYTGPGKDGQPLTLVTAMREAYGVGQARILRLAADGTWTTVVRSAGSIDNVEHVPSGRAVYRRKVRRFTPAPLTPAQAHAFGEHTLTDAPGCVHCAARRPLLDAVSAA